MMAFVKLHDSLTKSSIMEEEIHVRWAWTALLSLADRDGIIQGTVNTLARSMNLSVEQTQEALDRLCSPDPNSTTKTEEGRRIVAEGPNLWRVVNYEYYRQLGSVEDRQEKNRERQRRHKARKREESLTGNAPVTLGNASNDRAEAEAEAEAYICSSAGADERRGAIPFDNFWALYPRKVSKKRAETAWLNLTVKKQQEAMAALPNHRQQWEAERRDATKIPHASTWINGECWNDEFAELPHAHQPLDLTQQWKREDEMAADGGVQ